MLQNSENCFYQFYFKFLQMDIDKTYVYKAQPFPPSLSQLSNLNLNMSSAVCVQVSSSATSSLLSLSVNPKAWIISFGKSTFLPFNTSSPQSRPTSSARSSILSVLGDAITVGHLTISDTEGTHHYGRYKDCNDVHLQVINDNFWSRILL
jgi:hypothetical protein